MIAAHPIHAAIDTRTPLRLPVGYNPTGRDTAIASIRTRIDAALTAGDRLLVLGIADDHHGALDGDVTDAFPLFG